MVLRGFDSLGGRTLTHTIMKANIYYLSALTVINAFAFQYEQDSHDLEICMETYLDSALHCDHVITPSDFEGFYNDAFKDIACMVLSALVDYVKSSNGAAIEQMFEDLNMGFFYVEF